MKLDERLGISRPGAAGGVPGARGEVRVHAGAGRADAGHAHGARCAAAEPGAAAGRGAPAGVARRRRARCAGCEFSPLYKSVPQAARRDAKLYELLALVDAIRAGGGQEREAAVRELQARLAIGPTQVQARRAASGVPSTTRQSIKANDSMAKKPNGYTAEDIEILEDLSPILHRPGMYTDPVNPNHALVEIIDNSADEGLAGFAKNVAVMLYEDGSAEVVDDGRGIPVDIHPKKKVPAVQVIFTTLHSGGKFRKTDKDAAYRIAGGLHGVGVCVQQRACRSASKSTSSATAPPYRIVFADNGKVKEPLKKTGTRGRARTPARACASGPIPSISIRRRSSPPTSPRCCAPRPCCCRACKFTLGHREERQDRDPDLALSARASRATSRRAIAGQEPVAEHLLRRALHRRAVRVRQLRRGRRRDVGHRLDAGWRAGHRVLRQHDSDAPRRYARRRACARACTTPSRTSSTCTPWASAA